MAQEIQENQEIDPELSLTYTPGKKETNPFLVAIKEKAVEYKIQKLLGVNPKTWNDLKDKGILPKEGTYEDFLILLFAHYKKKGIAKNLTAEASSDESEYGQVVRAEKIQKIRLDRAREQEVHLKNLSARNDLINKQELYELIAPLLGNIANILRSTAEDDPKLQEPIDKCFHSLHIVGVKLLEQAGKDNKEYVDTMLNTEVDLIKLIEETELIIG